MKTRYYFDDETYGLYVIEEDGQVSALDIGAFWGWVKENQFNHLPVVEDQLDHTGAHVQTKELYIENDMLFFMQSICDVDLMRQYIATHPKTFNLIEIL